MRWLVLALLMYSPVFGQDSIDTTRVHSFKRAMLYSAILPGAGQVYNHIAMPKGSKKAYWKVPLIYAGLGATGYYALQNNTLKNDFKQEYKSRKAGNAPVLFQSYDYTGLETGYVSARNQRDLFLLGFGFVYLLNVIDAGVEAHFVNFDVSENLELAIHPSIQGNQNFGVGLTLNFK